MILIKVAINIQNLSFKTKYIGIQIRIKLNFHCIPVSTRRFFDVYTMSITLKRRRMDVKTTSCAYWDWIKCFGIKMTVLLDINSPIFFIDTYPMLNRIAKVDKKLDISSSTEKFVFTDKGDEFSPKSVKSNDNLDYIFKNEKGGEGYLNSYFMQVSPLQQQTPQEQVRSWRGFRRTVQQYEGERTFSIRKYHIDFALP